MYIYIILIIYSVEADSINKPKKMGPYWNTLKRKMERLKSNISSVNKKYNYINS